MRKNSKTKFKKFLALFLSMIIMLGVFSGCRKTETENNLDVGNSSEKEDDGLKLPTIGNISSKLKTTKISRVGLFSEGLCVLELQNEEDTMYCIDENGDIKFKVENQFFYDNCEFINGLSYIQQNTFCNTKGEIIRPEDVGVTNFYPTALKEGYILAEVVTASFDSTVMEFGIMDTDFNWVVEPSVELYSEIYRNGKVNQFSVSENYKRYGQNGYCYIENIKGFLELSTGKIYYYPDIPLEFPAECGYVTHDYKFVDIDDNVYVDLSKYYASDVTRVFYSGFENGYLPILFYNYQADTCYITLYDKNGKALFEPVEVWKFDRSGSWQSGFEMTFDGEYILVEYGNTSMKKAKCFDIEGNLVGEFNPDTSNRSSNLYLKFNDGVIIYYKSLDFNKYEILEFYNPNFTPLF